MRELVSYVIAGALVISALGFLAPPAGLAVGISAQTVQGLQTVDRRHKGNRLPEPAAAVRKQAPARRPAMMTGCDPAFSPLSASAKANFAARCVA